MIADLPDIPRIYTALAEWSACLVFLVICKKRMGRVNIIVISAVFLAAQSLLLMSTRQALGIWWVFCMLAAALFMFLFIFTTCAVTIADAGYFAIHAFVLAEFAASLEWQIHCFFWPVKGSMDYRAILLLICTYGSIFLGACYLVKRHASGGMFVKVERNHFFVTAVIGISVFTISNLSFLTTDTPFSGQYSREIFNIRTITVLCGILLLAAYNLMRKEIHTKNELDIVQRVLRNQYEQYVFSRDSLEHINRTYHDLKHQIAFLREEEDVKRRSDFLDIMENDIKTYEAKHKTGNHVLDTILTGKALFCAQHNIGLTCVADGGLLDFIDIMDICTIIGNALDNAIEHVLHIKDTEKRLIHMVIFSKTDFLIIRFENYMEGKLYFDGRLPATTKADNMYHGYGLKSIRYVAEKYNGRMNVEVSDSWFNLEIVIPMMKL